MTKILALSAREILDSRGEPTVEVTLCVERGAVLASVPAGASTGRHEAHELRDGDPARFGGRGVTKAVANINGEIAAAVVGKAFEQESLDRALIELDGTPERGRLGANALLGVSLAFARGAALGQGVELYEYFGHLDERDTFALPTPMFNVLNGGKHARDGLDIQEFMLVPVGLEGIAEQVRAISACVKALGDRLAAGGFDTGLGDEGGFAPRLSSNEAALDMLVAAVGAAGFSTEQIKIALDCAASSFYRDGAYHLRAGGHTLGAEELVEWYQTLAKNYPLMSLEDGCAEDDWEGFTKLNTTLGEDMFVVGDDLTVTNAERVAQAAECKAINAMIVKPNQAGTVSEALAAVRAARGAGWQLIASHRSGETNDDFIADFAIGIGAKHLKAGSLRRGERVAKYNRLLALAALER